MLVVGHPSYLVILRPSSFVKNFEQAYYEIFVSLKSLFPFPVAVVDDTYIQHHLHENVAFQTWFKNVKKSQHVEVLFTGCKTPTLMKICSTREV